MSRPHAKERLAMLDGIDPSERGSQWVQARARVAEELANPAHVLLGSVEIALDAPLDLPENWARASFSGRTNVTGAAILWRDLIGPSSAPFPFDVGGRIFHVRICECSTRQYREHPGVVVVYISIERAPWS